MGERLGGFRHRRGGGAIWRGKGLDRRLSSFFLLLGKQPTHFFFPHKLEVFQGRAQFASFCWFVFIVGFVCSFCLLACLLLLCLFAYFCFVFCMFLFLFVFIFVLTCHFAFCCCFCLL